MIGSEEVPCVLKLPLDDRPRGFTVTREGCPESGPFTVKWVHLGETIQKDGTVAVEDAA